MGLLGLVVNLSRWTRAVGEGFAEEGFGVFPFFGLGPHLAPLRSHRLVGGRGNRCGCPNDAGNTTAMLRRQFKR
jgi:hypothetical protein